jgi:hypothetical protein
VQLPLQVLPVRQKLGLELEPLLGLLRKLAERVLRLGLDF